jgi:2,4-dienoyl-CoA reductase-like NADH-dependent reductase (Old Yellow Enzyme family)
MAKTKFQQLLSPLKMGDLELKNRVIMASMTRNRNLVPQQVNVDYYTQRANAGLVLTEGTLVAQQGTQWPAAPGIYTDEQTAAWTKVVDSVHKAGGIIFLQVYHTRSR